MVADPDAYDGTHTSGNDNTYNQVTYDLKILCAESIIGRTVHVENCRPRRKKK